MGPKSKDKKGKRKEPEPERKPDPPVPLSYATLPLRPGHPPGFAVQRSLFYNSTSWHALIHEDVDALLAAFASAYTAVHDASPFATFKQLWVDLGWSRIHLLGVLDGPMRGSWADSVYRAFIEHIHQDEDAIKQIAALFAIYTFWATQAKSQEQIHIQIDPPTLDYFRTLPLKLSATFASHAPTTLPPTPAPSIDPTLDPALFPAPVASSSTLPDPSPVLDLVYVMANLLRSNAFFIIPSEAFLHPQLPATSVTDVKEELHEQSAMLVLGAEQEMHWIREGKIDLIGGVRATRASITEERERKRRKIEQDVEDGYDSDEDEELYGNNEGDRESDDDSEMSYDDDGVPGAVGLHGTTLTIADTSRPPQMNLTGTPSSELGPWSTHLRASSSTYLAARRALVGSSSGRDQIIHDAEDKTLAAIRNVSTTSAAAEAVPGLLAGQGELRLLGLVGAEGYVRDEATKGLAEFTDQIQKVVDGE